MKDHTDETNSNGKGRPSKFEQLQIERKLKSLFMSGLSPYAAAKETGCSINTVKKYYGGFFQEIRDLEGPEFNQACKDRRISACLALEEQLLKMEKMQKELEQMPQTGTPYIQLCKLKIGLANLISDLLIKKLNISNSPTADEMLAALRKVGEQK